MKRKAIDGDRARIKGAVLTAKANVSMVAGRMAWGWNLFVYRGSACVAQIDGRFLETTSDFAAKAAITFAEQCGIDASAIKAELAKVKPLPAWRSKRLYKGAETTI